MVLTNFPSYMETVKFISINHSNIFVCQIYSNSYLTNCFSFHVGAEDFYGVSLWGRASGDAAKERKERRPEKGRHIV